MNFVKEKPWHILTDSPRNMCVTQSGKINTVRIVLQSKTISQFDQLFLSVQHHLLQSSHANVVECRTACNKMVDVFFFGPTQLACRYENPTTE